MKSETKQKNGESKCVNNHTENEFFFSLRVYMDDTDAGGIVYYVNYVKFFERARTEYLRKFELGPQDLESDEGLMVLASADVDYLGSAKLDDQLCISVKVRDLESNHIVFEQSVFREQQLLCSGTFRLAYVSRQTYCARPLPDTFIDRLAVTI